MPRRRPCVVGTRDRSTTERGSGEGMVRAVAVAVMATVAAAGAVAPASAAPAAPIIPTAGRTDVCAVVPATALAIAAGNQLRPGVPAATPLGDGSCRFAAQGVSDSIDVELTISTHRRRDAKRTAYAFGTRTAFERIYGNAQRVRGVDGRAFYTYSNDVGRQSALLVIRHNTAVQVVLNGSITSPTKGRHQAMAIADVTLHALAGPQA